MEREEELIQRAVIKLNAKLLGIVLGILMGFGLFLATILLVIKGGPNVGLHLNLLGNYFPGYQVTYLGSVIGFFYGFLVVALAWQVAFLVIGSDPLRFRLLMIPGIIEKLGYVATLGVLYRQARIPAADAMAAVPDLLLGILFIIAFVRTRDAFVSGGRDRSRSTNA